MSNQKEVIDEIRLAAIQRCLRALPLIDRLLTRVERNHADSALESDALVLHVMDDLRAGRHSRGELARLARAIAVEIGHADRLVKKARKRYEREQRACTRATDQIQYAKARADAEHAILREYLELRTQLGRVVLEEAERI